MSDLDKIAETAKKLQVELDKTIENLAKEHDAAHGGNHLQNLHRQAKTGQVNEKTLEAVFAMARKANGGKADKAKEDQIRNLINSK